MQPEELIEIVNEGTEYLKAAASEIAPAHSPDQQLQKLCITFVMGRHSYVIQIADEDQAQIPNSSIV